MKRFATMACVLLAWAVATMAGSEEEPAQAGRKRLLKNPLVVSAYVVTVAEGLAAINAGMATASPVVYGGLCIIISPFALASDTNKLVAIAGFAAVVGIGAYNLTIASDDDMSDREVFRNNMVAWNIFYVGVASAAISGHFLGENDEDKVALGMAATLEGPMLTMGWRF